MILGIMGKKGAGKDSLSDTLVPHGYNKIAFALQLKLSCMQIFHLSKAQVFGDISVKETVDKRWGITPREILQKFGTEVGRNIHPETWVMNAMMSIDREEATAGRQLNWVFSDLRFPNEADAVREAEGLVIRIDREGISTGLGETHASETEGDKIKPDLVVVNNGALEDLEYVAHTIHKWARKEVELTSPFYSHIAEVLKP